MMLKNNGGFFAHLPSHERRITLATCITLMRFLLIPLIVYTLYYAQWPYALGLMVFAGISDACDGFVARWRNECTQLGALLDPIADKLLILSCYATLAFVSPSILPIPLWLLYIVFIKECLLMLGYVYLSLKGRTILVQPTQLGKAAMAVQVFFIGWLIACTVFNWFPVKTYYAILSCIAFLIFTSFYQYARTGMGSLIALLTALGLSSIFFISITATSNPMGEKNVKESIALKRDSSNRISLSKIKEHIITTSADLAHERIALSRIIDDLDELTLNMLDSALNQEGILAHNDRKKLTHVQDILKDIETHLKESRLFFTRQRDLLKKEVHT